MRLTLRTLLAYLDDALEPAEAREIGRKINESEAAKEMVARIRQVTRRRRLTTPEMASPDKAVDPNVVAAYLDNELDAEGIAQLEKLCLESDVNLAEVAACHQILTLISSQPARVPPPARQRMYQLVEGPESSRRKAAREKPPSALPAGGGHEDEDEALLLGLPVYGEGQSRRQKLAYTAAALLLIGGLATILYYIMLGDPIDRRVAVGPSSGPGANGGATQPAGPTRPAPTPVLTAGQLDALLAQILGPGRAFAGLSPADPVKPLTVLPKHLGQVGVLPGATPNLFDGFALFIQDILPDKLPELPLINEANRRPEEVALYVSTAAKDSLVLRQPDDKNYFRLRPGKKEPVRGGELIITLPGYRGEFELPNEVRVETVGNFYRPETPLNFVLESVVEFHRNAMVDLDLTLHRGRMLIYAPPKDAARLRVRFADRVLELRLSPGGVVSLELQSRLVRGRGSWTPNLYLSLVTVAGDADLRRGVRVADAPRGWDLGPVERIFANSLVLWDLPQESRFNVFKNVGEDAMPWVKKAPLPDDMRQAAIVIEDRVRNQLEKGGGAREAVDLRDAFFRALHAEKASLMERRLAIYCLTAIDHLKPVLLAMETERDRPDVRTTALNSLWHWLGRSPKQSEALKPFLKDADFSAEDADLLLELLRGWLALDRDSTETLLKGLGHRKSLGIREAAFLDLMQYAPDVAKAVPYNPANDPETIDRSVERIRRMLVKPQ